MFTVTGTVPAIGLDVDQLWPALRSKAEDPIPFVRAISACEVRERGEDYLVRDITLRGQSVREYVSFEENSAVRFRRLSGPVWGEIQNVIEERADGLHLRFTFCLEVDGMRSGSEEEAAYAKLMRRSYLAAIRSTLAEARRRAAGKGRPS